MLQNECCAFLGSKSFTEKRFLKKRLIFLLCSLQAKPLIFGEIWELASKTALKELSSALFRGVVFLLVPELCTSLSRKKNAEIGQIWPLVTSVVLKKIGHVQRFLMPFSQSFYDQRFGSRTRGQNLPPPQRDAYMAVSPSGARVKSPSDKPGENFLSAADQADPPDTVLPFDFISAVVQRNVAEYRQWLHRIVKTTL